MFTRCRTAVATRFAWEPGRASRASGLRAFSDPFAELSHRPNAGPGPPSGTQGTRKDGDLAGNALEARGSVGAALEGDSDPQGRSGRDRLGTYGVEVSRKGPRVHHRSPVGRGRSKLRPTRERRPQGLSVGVPFAVPFQLPRVDQRCGSRTAVRRTDDTGPCDRAETAQRSRFRVEVRLTRGTGAAPEAGREDDEEEAGARHRSRNRPRYSDRLHASHVRSPVRRRGPATGKRRARYVLITSSTVVTSPSSSGTQHCELAAPQPLAAVVSGPRSPWPRNARS